MNPIIRVENAIEAFYYKDEVSTYRRNACRFALYSTIGGGAGLGLYRIVHIVFSVLTAFSFRSRQMIHLGQALIFLSPAAVVWHNSKHQTMQQKVYETPFKHTFLPTTAALICYAVDMLFFVHRVPIVGTVIKIMLLPIGAFATLLFVGNDVKQKWDESSTSHKATLVVKEVAYQANSALSPVAARIAEAASSTWKGTKEGISPLASGVVGAADNAWQAAKGKTSRAWGAVSGYLFNWDFDDEAVPMA